MYKFFNARRLSLDDLAANLAAFLGESDLPLRFVARTVVVRVDGEWHHFATVARPSSERVNANAADLDDVMLIESSFPVDSTIRNADDLRDRLAAWRLTLDVSSGFPFQSSFFSTHQGSENSWADSPAWELQLHEALPRDRSYGLPNGPFLNERLELFGTSVGQLAAKWLGTESVAQQNSTDSVYRLILPDRRLWVKTIEYDKKLLTLVLEGTHEPDGVACVARVTDRQGNEHEIIRSADHRAVQIELPVEPVALNFWLMVGGEVLDRIQENEHWHSRRARLLRIDRFSEAEPESDLRGALESGENDTTEFKLWLDVPKGDSKMSELAESVVAFANRRGGRIFIGVNNNAEPIGINKLLRDVYGPLIKGPTHLQREVYVEDLRRFISQAVDPAIPLEFTWIEYAKQLVLRIRVPDISSIMHSVVGTSEVFIRRGATNRKVKHADLLHFWTSNATPLV